MALQDTGTIQVITFCIDDQLYGINVLQLDEILPILKIKSIPKGPEFLEGVINLRGDIIPVMDLRRFFGCVRKNYNLETRIFVSSFEERRLGFIADDVKSIKEFSVRDVRPSVIESDQARFIQEMAQLETGEIIQLITVARVLDDQSLNQITKLNIPVDDHEDDGQTQ